jgi:hypothetical protein
MPRRLSGERGASLLLAIGFLAAFSFVIPALLRLGSTNFLATSRLREQRGSVYAADGAMDGAIQYLRAHQVCGGPTGTCPISQFTATLNGVTATTTWNYDASRPIDYDRTFDLSTSVNGVPRVTARIIVRYAHIGGGEIPVDVLNWTYKR